MNPPTQRRRHVCCEELESRQLLTAWGAIPQLIDQDVAVGSYGQYNGSGQTIAIIDTGADYNTSELSGKYLGGYDFVDNDSDPMDSDGHGTAISSLAVGNAWTYNGAQYQGIATGARIVVLRVDDNNTVPDSRYEAAFQWIIAHRAQYNITVVNASFGVGHYSTEAQRTVYADEMETLANSGVFIVAASGNDGPITPYGIEYPAADPSAYAVGSVNSNDGISKFTERGAIMDFLAPGEFVPVPYIDNGQPTVISASGTSFSAPFIAGTAAIIKQIDPSFTAADVSSILRASGIDKFDDGYTRLSWPRLDVDNAIALALQRKKGQASVSSIGNHGRENALKFDRDGVLYYAWYDDSDHHLKFATQSDDGQWSGVQTIDRGADVGHYVSLAMTSTGKPAVAYYDANNGDLKYALWNGNRWGLELVDGTRTTGYYPSLGFDSEDDPIITYYSKSAGDLRLAFNDSTGWALSTVDSSGDTGRYSSFAISNTGVWSVAYENTSTGQFRYASKGGKSWSIQTIDSTTRIGGGYVSLAYDGSNLPGVSYYDAYNANLKFAKYSGRSWSNTVVASQFSQGLYSNLFLDSGGTADIVYYNKTADTVSRAVGGGTHWTISELFADGGRHVFTARYGSYTVLAYYRTSQDKLVVAEY